MFTSRVFFKFVYKITRMVFPNVLITGTPGVGKSRLCKELLNQLGDTYKWHNVSQVAKDNDCVSGMDEEYDCPVLNEDKVCALIDRLTFYYIDN